MSEEALYAALKEQASTDLRNLSVRERARIYMGRVEGTERWITERALQLAVRELAEEKRVTDDSATQRYRAERAEALRQECEEALQKIESRLEAYTASDVENKFARCAADMAAIASMILGRKSE